MDTFDSTVQKAKEVFDTAVKKTGNFVSVSKRKIELSTLYGKLEKAYAKLGKIQYNKIKNEETDDVKTSSVIVEIKHILNDIKNLKEEIDKAEGKIECPKCGKNAPANSSFCNYCGADLNSNNVDGN